MAKGKDPKIPWETRAGEALSGKRRLDAASLISLVNEVNPTGRGRDARENAARYALKARLESLLVDRFPSEIEVTRDPEVDAGRIGPSGQEGVVSLRLLAHPQVACHAVLEALDDEARAWAQRQLDLGEQAPDSRADPLPPEGSGEEEDAVDSSDPEVVLAAAERAEAEYDFEEAGRRYARAFHVRKDGRSAVAWLRFLVDAMAADQEALAVERDLPAALRAHPGVHALLGIAAARSGDEAAAMAHLGHAEGESAAPGLCLAARLALSRGDTDAAAARLSAAARVDPASPDLRALEDDLAKAREAQRAPLEAELGRLLADGRDVEAERCAETLLARWPESEAARRAARSLSARRQSEEGRRTVAEAEAARSRGELAMARALFSQAMRGTLADGDRERARRAVADIEAGEREREAAHQVDRMAAALAHRDDLERARAFAAYADLDEPLRARVRAREELPALEWIDAMIRSGVRAAAAVDAALTLGRAVALPREDPAAALALLEGHERALEGVAFARRFAAEARERAAAERRRRAVADLTAAEEAVGRGLAEQAHVLFDRAVTALGRAEKGRVEALRARLDDLDARRTIERRFERARAGHQYLEAQGAADALAQRDGPENARWTEVARTLRDEVRRERRVRVYEGGLGIAESHGNYLSTYPDLVHAVVDLRQGTVVLPTACGSEVFLRSYDLVTGRLIRAIHLVAPDGVDEPSLELSGGNALVQGGSNGVLEVALPGGDPVRWSPFRDPDDMETRFSHALRPVVGGRYLWVYLSGDGSRTYVYDLESDRPRREIQDATDFLPLRGVTPPRVVALRNETVLSFHEPGGPQTGRLDFPDTVEAVAPHPAGEGLVVVFRRIVKTPNIHHQTSWAEISPQGEILRDEPIPGLTSYARAMMVTARDLGMVFVRVGQPKEEPFLLALARDPAAPGAPCLRVAWRAPIGDAQVLVQDEEGRRVYVLDQDDEGVHVFPLGPEAPALAPSPDRTIASSLHGLWGCTQPAGSRSKHALSLFLKSFKWHSPPEIAAAAARYRRAFDGDREKLVDLFWGQALGNDQKGAAAFGRELQALYADHPETEQVAWGTLAVEMRWRDLREKLGPLDDTSLPEPERKHRHHLLAAACFAEGDLEEAASHLSAGQALIGSCELAPLAALRDALAEPLPAGDIGRDLPPLRQLLAIVSTADALLARRDHEAVLGLYERALPWEAREAQSLARLAVAHLALPARDDAARLRKSLALALFADSLAEARVGFRREVLVPGATWTADRLDAIAAQARAWVAAGHDGDRRSTPGAHVDEAALAQLAEHPERLDLR